MEISEFCGCLESSDQDWFTGNAQTDGIEYWQSLKEDEKSKVRKLVFERYGNMQSPTESCVFEPFGKFIEILLLCGDKNDILFVEKLFKETQSKNIAFYIANVCEFSKDFLLSKLERFNNLDEYEQRIIEQIKNRLK